MARRPANKMKATTSPKELEWHGGKGPHILNFRTRHRWVISFTLQLSLTMGRSATNTQSSKGHDKDKILNVTTGNETLAI